MKMKSKKVPKGKKVDVLKIAIMKPKATCKKK